MPIIKQIIMCGIFCSFVQAGEKHALSFDYIPHSTALLIKRIAREEPLGWLRFPYTRLCNHGIRTTKEPNIVLNPPNSQSRLDNQLRSALTLARKKNNLYFLRAPFPSFTKN
jgi:hypothetical protein